MGYDYTENDIIAGGQTASDPSANLDNFEIASAIVARDADEIESDRSWRQPPPGTHELVVTGFGGPPKMVARKGFIGDRQVSWNSYMLAVRLSLANDRGASVLDYFDMPPTDPQEQQYYILATKMANGDKPGFMAEKFGHFISRLGFAMTKGQPMPENARKPKNWVGRHVIATIELNQEKDKATDQPKMDPSTGEPYPPRAQVKLFSYKPSMNQPIASMGGAAPAQQATAPTTQAPAAPTPAPTPTPTASPAPTPTASPDRLASLANQL